MSKKKNMLGTVLKSLCKFTTNDEIQKRIFGVYADDTPRSLADAINGEILSPKERKRILLKEGKNKKKKNKYKTKL